MNRRGFLGRLAALVTAPAAAVGLARKVPEEPVLISIGWKCHPISRPLSYGKVVDVKRGERMVVGLVELDEPIKIEGWWI